MSCVRCGLSVRLRPDQLTWDCCPRCMGRDEIPVRMFVSSRRNAPVSRPPPTAVNPLAAEDAVAVAVTGFI
ncbi:MAG: hypothetical protein ACR2LV_07420 [Solirubrobacteraceae bacterium]